MLANAWLELGLALPMLGMGSHSRDLGMNSHSFLLTEETLLSTRAPNKEAKPY